MTRNFLITTPQFNGCSTLYEVASDKNSMMRVPKFSERCLPDQSKNLPATDLNFPLELTWIVMETALFTHFRHGQFKSVLRILYSSKGFMMHFYKKYIHVLCGEYTHIIISRLSSLFNSLSQSMNLLTTQQAYEGAPFIPVIHLTGSEFFCDWNNMLAWPFGPPFLKNRPRGLVVSKSCTVEVMDVQTGFFYMDEVWMDGTETDGDVFKATFVRLPNVVFSVVYFGRDLDISKSIAICVWVRFLRMFLGNQCGLYLGLSSPQGFICYETERRL